jgi:rRNA maturation endonuclease Nob1
MLNIILDTNVILRQPKILGLKIPNVSLLIPLPIIEELNSRAYLRGAPSDKRIDLIQRAHEDGSISIVNTDTDPYRQLIKKFEATNLSKPDLAILSLAIDFKMKGKDVKIASTDKEIIKFAASNGIKILDDSEIENLIQDFTGHKNQSSSKLKQEIVSYEKNEKKSFSLGVVLGIIITSIAYLAFNNIGRIVATINIWGTVSLILILGFCLFIFREKKRLSYGVVEFLVGALAIIILFQPDNFDYSKVDFNFEFGLKVLAGLYIMVRGQDNIVKALKDTKIGLYLKEKFNIGS